MPIIVGGMGVNISTAELALEACRLGGIGHISDAMNPYVSDKKFKTHYTKTKSNKHRESRDTFDKTKVKFDLEDLRAIPVRASYESVDGTEKRRRHAIFINVMEKLNMARAGRDPAGMRLCTPRSSAGIDGVTLSAGLHNGTPEADRGPPALFA